MIFHVKLYLLHRERGFWDNLLRTHFPHSSLCCTRLDLSRLFVGEELDWALLAGDIGCLSIKAYNSKS